jgi:ferredoxin
MTIKIDKDTCIACNACVAECPDGMEMQDDGKAGIKNQKLADAHEGLEDICPVGAITRD